MRWCLVKQRDDFTMWKNAELDRYTAPSLLLLVLKQTDDMKQVSYYIVNGCHGCKKNMVYTLQVSGKE